MIIVLYLFWKLTAWWSEVCLGRIRVLNPFKKYKINIQTTYKIYGCSWLKIWGKFLEETAIKSKIFVSAGGANLGIWEGWGGRLLLSILSLEHCIHFLRLLITLAQTGWLKTTEIYLFSHSSGGQKSDMDFLGQTKMSSGLCSFQRL